MTKLGELHISKGPALETAQQVLVEEKPHSCNVAWGCTNDCSGCYIPYYKKGDKIKLPDSSPCFLVSKQIDNGLKPKGVFLSFNTDPFLPKIRADTLLLIKYLNLQGIKVATLSKIDCCLNDNLQVENISCGFTIKTIDEEIRKRIEPNTSFIKTRINKLKLADDIGFKTWVSVEPFPVPEIYSEDLTKLLDSFSDFVDFIIFGKWNYNKLASNNKAKVFYEKRVKEFNNYCETTGIRHHVKHNTMEFIKEVKNNENNKR